VDYCPFRELILWIVFKKKGLKNENADFGIFCNILPLYYPQDFYFIWVLKNIQWVFLNVNGIDFYQV
jgi:hypothetical protein